MAKYLMMSMILIMQMLSLSWATPIAEADPGDVIIQIKQYVNSDASGYDGSENEPLAEKDNDDVAEEDSESSPNWQDPSTDNDDVAEEDLESCPNWQYPSTDWSTKYPNFCSGSMQSPIDLPLDDIMTEKMEKLEEHFTYTNYDHSFSSINIKNDGNSVIIKLDPSANTPSISGGGLDGHYTLSHVRFHWGCDNSTGSEHTQTTTVDKTKEIHRGAMEIHMIHYKTDYGSLESAIQHSDGLVSMTIAVNHEDPQYYNPNGPITALTPITDNLSLITEPGTNADVPFNMTFNDFLPNDEALRQVVIRYHGSLTTPPCNEVVSYSLFLESQSILQSQLEAFRTLKNCNGGPLCDNYRDTQPLNGRNVPIYNFNLYKFD